MEKIGVGITTYNSESVFKDLYNSLPHEEIDHLVVVNGGDKYTRQYSCDDWIQHKKNKGPAVSRNDCLKSLIRAGCDHIFLIEDDMIIKSPHIFNEYIHASLETNLKYFIFVSTSDGSGKPGSRTPRLKVQYKDSIICFYPNMCNEFTYHRRDYLEKYFEQYDEDFYCLWDVDSAYRYSKTPNVAPFWYFADILNSDDLIMNNPRSQSRLDSDGQRFTRLQPDFAKFEKKHNIHIPRIAPATQAEVIQKLKGIV